MSADIQIVTAPERRPSITQDELAQIAERIHARIRRTTEDIIQTGHDLVQVKAELDHGQFHEWIETKCGMTDRAARNYMHAARWAEGKPETISDLPPTTVYALASPSTPAPIRERVVADLEAGRKVNVHEVRSRIKMARGDRRLERDEESQRKARNYRRSAKYQRQRDREKTEHEARQKRMEEALQEACLIMLKLNASDLHRLLGLAAEADWFWQRLPKALAHAMRGAEP